MPDSLAEIVLAEGLLSGEEIKKAADWAEEHKLPLVVPLVRELGLDEVAIVGAIRRHRRLELVDPARAEVDPDALREVSVEEARRLRAMPLSIGYYGSGPRLLRVAMADPTDTIALKELEHLTGCQVEALVTTLSTVEEMVENAYRRLVTAVMKRKSGDGVSALHLAWSQASLEERVDALMASLVGKALVPEATLLEELRKLLSSSSDDPTE